MDGKFAKDLLFSTVIPLQYVIRPTTTIPAASVTFAVGWRQ